LRKDRRRADAPLERRAPPPESRSRRGEAGESLSLAKKRGPALHRNRSESSRKTLQVPPPPFNTQGGTHNY